MGLSPVQGHFEFPPARASFPPADIANRFLFAPLPYSLIISAVLCPVQLIDHVPWSGVAIVGLSGGLSARLSLRLSAAGGVQTLYIEAGGPWENGYCESFNSKLRDEFLNIELFNSLKEAQTFAEWWRRHFNAVRPRSSLGYRPPAPQTVLPPALKPPYVRGVAA